MEDPLLISHSSGSLYDLKQEPTTMDDAFNLQDLRIPPTSCSDTINQAVGNLFKCKFFCNFLKYEWLYSLTDKEIFRSSNDFQVILRDNFRELKTRQMSRANWHCIRRIIGRPRRFSYVFLEEERKSMNEKRRHMWFIQQMLNSAPLSTTSPEQFQSALRHFSHTSHVPLRLTPGTTVCTSLTSPVKGIYLGVIQQASHIDSQYHVSLEKMVLINSTLNNSKFPNKPNSTLGTYVVPENDVFPCSPSSTSLIPISTARSYLMSASGQQESKNDQLFQQYYDENVAPVDFDVEPLLSTRICDNEYEIPNNNLNNFKFQACTSFASAYTTQLNDATNSGDMMSDFIVSLAKTYRTLDKKQKAVESLKELNDSAESNLPNEANFVTVEFQQKYATLIVHLDELNRQLKHHIDIVLLHITEPVTDIQPFKPTEHEFPMPLKSTLADDYMLPQSLENPVVGIQMMPMDPNGQMMELPSFDVNSCAGPSCMVGLPDGFAGPAGPSQDSCHSMSNMGDCDIAGEYGMPNVAYLTDWRRKCEDEAFEMVNRLKSSQGRTISDESKSVLIAKLTSILTLLSHLHDNRMTNNELGCIEEVFTDIRQRLHPNNLKCFEQSIEQLVSHIILNLSPSILPMSSSLSSACNNPPGYPRHPSNS